ncbi:MULTISPECIES: hypothetical protein [Citrobacter]|uniref:hypothetical protein n=1 Tax=Citrobacter TaxID=544 RepID=UPI001BCF5C0E|nr:MULTISPECIES: hypothetical protein [Citrobacter]ELS1936145.1 hypothetical protein [Salmonella enterica]MDM3083198.1 hypothetical protein [Citrobacter sp. Cf141]CAF2414466.1 hypothetical protein AI2826V1_5078 [Citrobacter freundii]CAH5300337.1 hypothetical protein AI2826V1_5078 [Citrobacter freundii]
MLETNNSIVIDKYINTLVTSYKNDIWIEQATKLIRAALYAREYNGNNIYEKLYTSNHEELTSLLQKAILSKAADPESVSHFKSYLTLSSKAQQTILVTIRTLPLFNL